MKVSMMVIQGYTSRLFRVAPKSWSANDDVAFVKISGPRTLVDKIFATIESLEKESSVE